MIVDELGSIAKMKSRIVTQGEFDYDHLFARPLYSFMSQTDTDKLYNIASSIRYAGNPRKKFKAIDEVLKPLGFQKLSAGTNRLCYKHLEDPTIVTKVAFDAVALKDNPTEFMIQNSIKPFCTKIFEVSPDGAVGLAERVQPIQNREEFMSCANEVYDLINILTRYFILADIGSHYFMNYGIRTLNGFGPVILDFPYIFEPDGDKLVCHAPNENNPDGICGGLIDYDAGFNELVCLKCGVKYKAIELARAIKNNEIIRKGNKTMGIVVECEWNGKVYGSEDAEFGLEQETSKVQHKKKTEEEKTSGLEVEIVYNGKVINKEIEKYEAEQNSNKSAGSTLEVECVYEDKYPKKNTKKNNNTHKENNKPVENKKSQNQYKKPEHSQVTITAVTSDQLKDIDFKLESASPEYNRLLLKGKYNNLDLMVNLDANSIDVDTIRNLVLNRCPEIMKSEGLEAEYDKLYKKYNALLNYHNSYKEESIAIGEHNDEIEALKDEIAELKNENHKLSDEIADIEYDDEKLELADDEIKKLKNEIADLTAKNHRLSEELNEVEYNNEELESAKSDLFEAEEKIANYKRVQEELKDRLELLEKDSESKAAYIDAKDKDLNDYIDKDNFNTVKITELESIVEDLKNQNEDLTTQNKDLTHDFAVANEQCKSLNKTIDSLNDKIDQLENDISALEENNNRLNTELDSYQEKLNEQDNAEESVEENEPEELEDDEDIFGKFRLIDGSIVNMDQLAEEVDSDLPDGVPKTGIVFRINGEDYTSDNYGNIVVLSSINNVNIDDIKMSAPTNAK